MTTLTMPGVRATTRLLRHGNAASRYAAANLLAEVDHDRAGAAFRPAVESLILALSDRSAEVRIAAASALGTLGPAALASAQKLLDCITDEDPLLRTTAVVALGRFGKGSISFLIEALSSDDPEVRGTALIALGRNLPALRGSPLSIGVVAALRAALGDEDIRVQTAAATGLGILAEDASGAAVDLLRLLRDAGCEARSACAWALDQVGLEVGAEAALLLDILESEDAEVRYIAVNLIAGNLPATDGAQELELLWERMEFLAEHDADSEVREAAQEALAARSQ